MKHIIIGYGSIGKRHYRNLKLLAPEDEVVSIDPDPKMEADKPIATESDVRNSVVYICSPTPQHASELAACIGFGAAAIAVEKPMCDRLNSIAYIPIRIPFAVLYQYRFSTTLRQLKRLDQHIQLFTVAAGDNLLDRYGPTALETMCSHCIDYALWINGPAREWEISDEGKEVFVGIKHKSGCHSSLYCNIDAKDRYLMLDYRRGDVLSTVTLPADDQMYIDEMVAWLNYLKTGERGDLCSYEEALAVQEIMKG